ncbi:hypothetical protein [Hymenobacter yonginensis]|uniref:Glycosyltransferase RgtA/B/C/D-like domain-containing protein n=1 Tax=Hymenobacter yonginensis TaxID=748197 RepID=A0ABY7PL41_9BACT|nr:hypothetical protein [Hymenobacter yonginensis]WBO83424.1 hypothetical protein O9Z63_13650 [Hymenobacter yonginensis]
MPGTLSPALAARRPALLLLLFFFGVSVVFAFLSESTYDTSDSLNHFLYARYAFRHPANFAESWSKPLVVLVHALPAQAGLRGVMLLQCVCAAVAAWLAFGVARRLRLPWPALVILFIYAAPDYFRIQLSGMTEPLFSVVLMGSVALAVARRPVWAAVLVSWLPFVRSEGFLLLGVFGVYLLGARQWRALPGLLLGYVVYGVVGLFVYGDFWWVFTRNAYPLVAPQYGHGELLHFVRNLPEVIGWVQFGLLGLGGAQMLWAWAQPLRRREPRLFTTELLLVYGSVVVFIGAHSVFWWKGIFASYGLMRVVNGVVPLLALVALNGVYLLAGALRTERARTRLRQGVAAVAVLVVLLGLRAGFRWNRDFTRFSDQLLADKLAQALPNPRPRVLYAHPVVPYGLHLDPFDARQTGRMGEVRTTRPLPAGTLVVWDDWFAPTEYGVPLTLLQGNPQYRQRWRGAIPRNRFKPTTDSVRFIVFERL